MSFSLDAFAFSLEHIVVLLGKTMSRKLLHTSILDSSITNKNVMKSYVAWRLPLHVALKLAQVQSYNYNDDYKLEGFMFLSWITNNPFSLSSLNLVQHNAYKVQGISKEKVRWKTQETIIMMREGGRELEYVNKQYVGQVPSGQQFGHPNILLCVTCSYILFEFLGQFVTSTMPLFFS